jgi:hypothetical protein
MFAEEFDRRTRAIMDFVLEQASRNLPDDGYESRKIVAQRLILCARDGKTKLDELTTAAQLAVIELIAAADDIELIAPADELRRREMR